MKTTYQTNRFFRFCCFAIALIVLTAGIYSFVEVNDFSLVALLSSIVLSLVFLHQAFFIESFILDTDSFVYKTQLFNITLKQVNIPFRAMAGIERFQNVQFITRFIITYYNESGQLTGFPLRSFTLFSSGTFHPNIEKIMQELSAASGKEVSNNVE